MQASKSTYYDDKCLQCELCAHYGQGQYRDGTSYEVCREFAYILHTDKGIVTDVACTHFLSRDASEQERKMHKVQSMRDIEKRQRKTR